MGKITYKNCTIKVIQGDITDQPVDAIVNSANEQLENKRGVARAIEVTAGSILVNECCEYISQNERLKTGHAMVTNAGELPCKYVIHTVGPKCKRNQRDIKKESKLLKSCLQNVLKLMVEKDCKSICILAISTGIFNFPLAECARIYRKTIMKFIDKHTEEMKGRQIILCRK